MIGKIAVKRSGYDPAKGRATKDPSLEPYTWECQCGATGRMIPAMRGKFPDVSLAGLVRRARSLHHCSDPDIVRVCTDAENEQRERDAKRRANWSKDHDEIV